MNKKIVLGAALSCLVAIVAGCTKGTEGNGDTRSFASDCGTVVSSRLANPVDAKIAERGIVQPISPNLVLMGSTLIKLHAIEASSAKNQVQGALNLMNQLAREGEAFVFRAAPGCTTSLEGEDQEGIVGQVFSATGKSFSEALLKGGFVTADENDVCNGILIGSCYRTIQKGGASNNSGGGGGGDSSGEIRAFLWKPVSDSNGKLAIHVTPAGTVVVNGEVGTAQGGGNGFAELARFSQPGCGYGASARVQVLDSQGVPLLLNGSDTITIPNGCNRYCLEAGQVVQCVKR